MSVKVDIRMPPQSAFDNFERQSRGRMEAAALNASHIAAARAKTAIRREMLSSGLGRLGNAVDSGSDLEKRGAVFRKGTGFSASGWVNLRTRNERTVGAIDAYTQGAEITPRNGRWLWLPTDDIPARAGRKKITPANWNKFGLDKKIGPLVLVKSVNGAPLLVVKDASVSGSGKARSAKSLTKTGRLRKGQVARSFIVAFIAIPRTSRQARVDVPAIMRSIQQQLPAIIEDQLRKP
jgi:hypothetical protein